MHQNLLARVLPKVPKQIHAVNELDCPWDSTVNYGSVTTHTRAIGHSIIMVMCLTGRTCLAHVH